MTEQEIRAMRVAEAVHSARMERGGVTSSFFADARDYIEEHIAAQELAKRTRRRFGLDSVRLNCPKPLTHI